MKQKFKFILFIISVVVLSVALFEFCYLSDNKYTHPGKPAQSGFLALNDGTLQHEPVVFLTGGWEIYRDVLLTPEDFANQSLTPDEIIYIGQYGGFEGNDPHRSPHGSATYRMNILLPDEPAGYTLELPEIFSAYKLYIGGILTEQFGEPEQSGYRPQTGNETVSFLAAGNVEILIAVTDFSHTYSGVVYPPAFGLANDVSVLISTRMLWRTIVCAASLVLALFFLIAGRFMRKNKPMLLFGLLCVCFVGYTCYPVVKTIFRSGMGWYGFENFCFCAMLLLVGLLQTHILQGRKVFAKIFLFAGAAVCVCSLLRPLLPAGNLTILTAYSYLIWCYKWVAAGFITLSILANLKNNFKYGYIVLTGVLVFDCALAMDRLYPLYEPIYSGWFIEIAGFVVVMVLGVVMIQEAIRQYREKLALEGKVTGIEKLVDMQREYYPLILEGIEETRRARHDLRHHMRVVSGFLEKGELAKLEGYLNEYKETLAHMPKLSYCNHDVIDVILRHFAFLAEQNDIDFHASVAIPEVLNIENADIAALLSNLLENALEACSYITGEKKTEIIIKTVKSTLTILVDNSFDGEIKEKNGKFMSRKQSGREGVGMRSVRLIAKKYDGTAEFAYDRDKKLFQSVVLLKQ